ncbi:hypothetical protein [Dryocola sp. BD626]|uniref:hypothetical protein n=1 Tax=Dryocola sp. BD626 TaxID=3133273 RepID=UPI003F4F4A0A
MTTSREQFERWVNRRPLSKLIGFCERDGDGYMHLQHTQLWEAWHASRHSGDVLAYMTFHNSAVSPDDFVGGEEEMHHSAKAEGWTPLIAGITVKGDSDETNADAS